MILKWEEFNEGVKKKYTAADKAKDVMRITDMAAKAKDHNHMLRLAQTMANAIKSYDKAYNRGLAAENEGFEDIADIFFDRANELGFNESLTFNENMENQKPLYKWEKHDIVNYLERNPIKEEFTSQSLIRMINKVKYHGYDFGYSDKIISQYLSELAREGYLSVKNKSIKMGPSEETNSVKNSNNRKYRFGYKTLPVYKMI